MDITTIGLAVDSSQVDTAGSALDRMVTAGDGASTAAADRKGRSRIASPNANETMAMPQGVSRHTAQQLGAEFARQLKRALYRTGALN